MQFLTLKLGGGNLVFAATNTVRLPFQFPSPIAGAYAILQGTRFERVQDRETYYSDGDPDVEVKMIEVSVLPLFDALQSTTTGQVQIDFRVPADVDFSADLVFAEIDVLVVGI